MTTIVYLHGLGSTGNSEKSQAIRDRFPECTVLSPDLSPVCVKEVFSLLQANPHDKYVFVGTSLGGFWSNVFAHLTNSDAVLVNPSVTPSLSLRKGLAYNHATKEPFEITYEMLQEIKGAEEILRRIYNGNLINLFLAEDDDVIPFEQTVYTLYKPKSLTITKDGGHRYAMHWDKVLDKVAELI
jgi:predicted esterase YcpF (UPF0227 family)